MAKKLNRTLQPSIKTKKSIGIEATEIALDTTGKDFYFEAGQYIRVTLPQLSEEVPGGNMRDFTIVSSPNLKNEIRFAFKKSNSAFKKAIQKLKIGAKIKVQGPLGVFTLPKSQKVPLVFIAGGMGITPFLSMLRFISEEKIKQKIQLIYASSNKKEPTYHKELKAIAKKNSNFTLIETAKKIDKAFLKSISTPAATLWYLCGAPQMTMDLSRLLMKELNISEKKIHFEEYPEHNKISAHSPVKGFKETRKIIEKLPNETLIQPMLNALDQSALVAITDAQGTIQYVNQKFITVAKFSRKELIGQNHRILKSGFHPPKFYRNLWETISQGKVFRGEIKNKAKDGTFYWVDSNIAPIFNKKGEIEKYIAIRFLITYKKELEEKTEFYSRNLEAEIKKRTVELEEKTKELKINEEKYHKVFELSNDAIVIINSKGKVVEVNEVGCKMLGYSKKKSLTLSLSDFTYKKDLKLNFEKIKQTLKKGKARFETRFIHADKSLIDVEINASVYDKEKKLIQGVIRDITDQKK